jgi:hypothetical protein
VRNQGFAECECFQCGHGCALVVRADDYHIERSYNLRGVSAVAVKAH